MKLTEHIKRVGRIKSISIGYYVMHLKKSLYILGALHLYTIIINVDNKYDVFRVSQNYAVFLRNYGELEAAEILLSDLIIKSLFFMEATVLK